MLQGFNADGNMFGFNAKQATGRTFGGIGGAWSGSIIGAEMGMWFFGWGAIQIQFCAIKVCAF